MKVSEPNKLGIKKQKRHESKHCPDHRVPFTAKGGRAVFAEGLLSADYFTV